MGLLDQYRKRRAIAAFSKRLGPALSKRFGSTPYYTADQIGDVVGSGKLRRHRDYLVYAYCLFMSQKDFEALPPETTTGDFSSLRGEAHGVIGPGASATYPSAGTQPDPFQGPSPGDIGDPGL